jgi:murein DD-endopeptidase MepM/ murein hydrolase activator NlpD
MIKALVIAGILCLPLRHLSLSSPFGYRLHPVTGKYAFHAGIDLRARSDTVFAVLPGKVTATSYDRYLGIFIRIDHQEFQSTSGHLSQIFVMPGDSVSAGEPIAITGSTGRVTGEHLHFSIQFNHRYINPLKFLLAIENNLTTIKKGELP